MNNNQRYDFFFGLDYERKANLRELYEAVRYTLKEELDMQVQEGLQVAMPLAKGSQKLERIVRGMLSVQEIPHDFYKSPSIPNNTGSFFSTLYTIPLPDSNRLFLPSKSMYESVVGENLRPIKIRHRNIQFIGS